MNSKKIIRTVVALILTLGQITSFNGAYAAELVGPPESTQVNQATTPVSDQNGAGTTQGSTPNTPQTSVQFLEVNPLSSPEKEDDDAKKNAAEEKSDESPVTQKKTIDPFQGVNPPKAVMEQMGKIDAMLRPISGIPNPKRDLCQTIAACAEAKLDREGIPNWLFEMKYNKYIELPNGGPVVKQDMGHLMNIVYLGADKERWFGIWDGGKKGFLSVWSQEGQEPVIPWPNGGENPGDSILGTYLENRLALPEPNLVGFGITGMRVILKEEVRKGDALSPEWEAIKEMLEEEQISTDFLPEKESLPKPEPTKLELFYKPPPEKFKIGETPREALLITGTFTISTPAESTVPNTSETSHNSPSEGTTNKQIMPQDVEPDWSDLNEKIEAQGG